MADVQILKTASKANACDLYVPASGKCAFVGTSDGSIWLFNTISNEVFELGRHTKTVWCLDGFEGRLVSGGSDNLVKIWDTVQRREIQTLVGHETVAGREAHVRCVKVLEDSGNSIASGAADCTVRIWDLLSMSCKYVLRGHSRRIFTMERSTANILISLSPESVRGWNWATGECLWVIPEQPSTMLGVICCDLGVLTARMGGAVELWEVDTGTPPQLQTTLSGHSSVAPRMVAKDGLIITAGTDGLIQIWSANDLFHPKHRIEAHENSIIGFDYSFPFVFSCPAPCGKTCERGGRPRIWNVQTRERVVELGETNRVTWNGALRNKKAIISARHDDFISLEVWTLGISEDAFNKDHYDSSTPA